MSVINQVLSQLEQRGIHDTSGQTRAVAVVRRDRRKIFWGIFALVTCILLGVLIGSELSHRKSAEKPQAIIQPASPTQLASTVSPSSAVPALPVVAASAAYEVLAPQVSSVVMPTPAIISAQVFTDNKPIRAAKPLHTTKLDPPIKPQAVVLPVQAVSQPAVTADNLPVKKVSVAQQADAVFQQAIAEMNQGHLAEALAGYEKVLSMDPGHDAARQTLVALLLENKRGAEAERVLQAGLQHNPQQLSFAMLLARMQVERGAVPDGLQTLEACLPYAKKQADYQAFYAALLQRQGRHEEAVAHYQNALQQHPNHGVWLMGIGISLQALQRPADAKEAFQRALNSQTLPPNLQSFVQQQIKAL